MSVELGLPRELKPKVELPVGENAKRIFKVLKEANLTTICQEGRCPNIGRCWSHLHATFMLLGEICTRSCRFCSVRSGHPQPLTEADWENLRVLAEAVRDMGLRYVVLTMVTRDDLEDGGASFMGEATKLIRQYSPKTYVELLVSDLGGNKANLETLIDRGAPDVLGHNIETVARLTPLIRDRRASYKRSLEFLRWGREITDGKILLKSGIIVGLGETMDEVLKALEDLREVGVEAVTIGQYFQPSKSHYPVMRYYKPDEFNFLEEKAKEMGFKFVKAGYRVRSSYEAQEIVALLRKEGKAPGYFQRGREGRRD